MPWISREELQRLRQRASQADNLNDSLSSIQQSLQNLHHQYHDLKGTLVSAIDDLTAAVTDLTTASTNYTAAVAAEIAAIQAANQSGSNDAAIETSVGNLKSLTDSFNAATAAAQSAVAPPAPTA